MIINAYKLNDFGKSKKAIWLSGVWRYPRLEPRYNKFFFPKSQVAIKSGEVFIPAWLVESFLKQNSSTPYKFCFPSKINTYNTTKERWDEFLDLYKFEKTIDDYVLE